MSAAEIKAVYAAFDARVSNSASASPFTDAYQTALWDKLIRGTENFYLAGFRYSWTRAYWSIAGTINLGGYIESPGGPLTGMFPAGISWLRQADDVKFTGQHFRYTVSWLGAPDGHWDTDLY